MHFQYRSKKSIRTVTARWSRAGAALPLLALCRCVGTVDATSPDHSTDAGDDLAAVVIQHDAAGSATSADAGDAGADAVSGDGGTGDGGTGDGATNDGPIGDGAIGDGAVEGTSTDDASGDGAGGDGALDGANGEATVDAGKPCDATATPKDNACVIDSAYGVFVAATLGDAGTASGGRVAEAGTDGGDATAPSAPDGSPTNPYFSITDALAHIGNRSRIFVCDGNYSEQVTITTPVSLYGGLSCTSGVWRWDGGATQVTSPTANYALSISGLNTAAIDVQDIAFTAPDASAPGASSVAAIIATSTVTLTRVVLAAGRGAKGADGVTGPGNFSGGTAPAGGDRIPGFSTCVNGDTSFGGYGGSACDNSSGTCVISLAYGLAGTANPMPPKNDVDDGAGGSFDPNLGAGTPGDAGTYGYAMSSGGAAASMGVLLPGNVWTPSQGTDGLAGTPGQGGGGGGDCFCSGGNGIAAWYIEGGGGGAGGCGGSGGLGGNGGGASIALLSVNNSVAVSLVSSALSASEGGAGGNGGQGQDGQLGGNGYVFGPPVPMACPGGAAGGNGGNGAGGSGGGGGTGGISVGILYRGIEPVWDVSTGITPGAAGSPGAGGLPGSQTLITVGNPGSPGLDGVSAAYLGPI